MLANLAMKVLGEKPVYVLYPAVAAAMIAGCLFQVIALKNSHFALAVVLILGLEMLFSLLIAQAFLGETYSLTNMAGVVLVIIGMGLVHVPATEAPAGDRPAASTAAEKGPRLPVTPSAEAEPPV
jgi:uncharacterized membrane protein